MCPPTRRRGRASGQRTSPRRYAAARRHRADAGGADGPASPPPRLPPLLGSRRPLPLRRRAPAARQWSGMPELSPSSAGSASATCTATLRGDLTGAPPGRPVSPSSCVVDAAPRLHAAPELAGSRGRRAPSSSTPWTRCRRGRHWEPHAAHVGSLQVRVASERVMTRMLAALSERRLDEPVAPRRHRGDAAAGSRRSVGRRSPSAASASRRRTSTAEGAGYSSLPGRQPSGDLLGPGPSSAQTWHVLVRKEKPPSRVGCSPPPFSVCQARRRGRALNHDGPQGAGQELEVAAAALAPEALLHRAGVAARHRQADQVAEVRLDVGALGVRVASSCRPRRRRWSGRPGGPRGRAP